jgi:type IV secretory pathway TraG/TraD family ATPase VirD4
LLEGIAHTDSRELSGIFSTADSLLATYRTDAAVGAARFPNFDVNAFASSTDTTYICAPSTSQALHAPLVVCMLDQIRTAVYRARRTPPMFFALDEVAHIAPLPDLVSTIAEGGSQGLVVMACLQDMSQARARRVPAPTGS